MVFEDFFPYLVLTGYALLAIGWVVLLVAAFRARLWWGFGVLVFPPTAVAFMIKHSRKAAIAMAILAIGLLLAAGPPLYVRLRPIDLGPRERIVAGETHLTLTGWDHKDYAFLRRKPEVIVLQMANPDVTDASLSYLTGMTHLRELDLNGTQVTDAGLETLRTLASIERLRLRDTAVTDAGFNESLSKMESLREIDLRGTKVTRETAKSWKDAKAGRRVMQ